MSLFLRSIDQGRPWRFDNGLDRYRNRHCLDREERADQFQRAVEFVLPHGTYDIGRAGALAARAYAGIEGAIVVTALILGYALDVS